MKKFHTETGSVYQVNTNSKQIRRLTGVRDPQPRQGKDGEWKTYIELLLDVGMNAVIFWDPASTPLHEGSPAGAAPSTITSKVVEIIDESVAPSTPEGIIDEGDEPEDYEDAQYRESLH